MGKETLTLVGKAWVTPYVSSRDVVVRVETHTGETVLAVSSVAGHLMFSLVLDAAESERLKAVLPKPTPSGQGND